MATEELLKAEARERPRMAVVAGLAALFTLLSPLVGIVALKHPPDNLIAAALQRHQHTAALALSAACSVLGLIAIAFVLDFLYRATRARNPALPANLRPLPWLGALGLAVLSVALQIAGAVKLDHFATHSSFTYEEAKAASDFGAVAYLGIVAQLALALAIVMLSINAMRVGLLTRFLGYLGVISAALFILPLVPLPIVQIYWLGALAALFAGRMPAGTPVAWERGTSVPWPSPAEMREARVKAAEERRDGGGGRTAAAGEPPEGAAAPSAAGSAGAGAPRRKRKKRR